MSDQTKNTPDNSFAYELGKDIKKIHNTADTSIMAFRQLVASGQIKRESQQVYEAIKVLKVCTSRMLMNFLKKERGNITRSLFNLENCEPPLIKVAYKDKCKVTSKTVKFYTIIEKEEAQNAA